MNKLSRRALARWAADQLIGGQSAASVAEHLAAVLKQSAMTGQAGFLINDIAWELEQHRALAVGTITSARPLSRQLEAALAAQIKRLTGAADIVLEKRLDKSVLGGLRVETASHVWDATVARQLAQLKEAF